jgi:hypothetical protein
MGDAADRMNGTASPSRTAAGVIPDSRVRPDGDCRETTATKTKIPAKGRVVSRSY